MKLFIRKKEKSVLSLKEFNIRRNKVLIKRRVGGFGDVLMQRMIFEDCITQYPQIKFEFTCPQEFLPFIEKHPYIHAISLNNIQDEDYGMVFDISKSCSIHEMRTGINNTMHRSDIWANTIGIELKNHNMHLSVNYEHTSAFETVFKKHNPKDLPIALICVESLHNEFGICKSLTPQLIEDLVGILRNKGFFVCSINKKINDVLTYLNVLQFTNIVHEQWIFLTNYVKFVISVDTATFHLAGGLKKPLVGIFSFTNGKVVGKYFDFILVQKHKDNGNWDCGPCWNFTICSKCTLLPKPCIKELNEKDVEVGIQKAIEKWNLI
jgi:ADP-heptose:LPS heptosyltransferase